MCPARWARSPRRATRPARSARCRPPLSTRRPRPRSTCSPPCTPRNSATPRSRSTPPTPAIPPRTSTSTADSARPPREPSPACTSRPCPTTAPAASCGATSGPPTATEATAGCPGSSACGQLRRRRRARADLGLERGKLLVHLGRRPGLVELLLDVVGVSPDVLEHAGLEQLVHGAGPGLHHGDLVLGPLDFRPRVAEGLGDPGGALAHGALGLRGGVLGLEHLLLRPEVVDPLLQGREGLLELLLLLGQLLVLGLHRVDLCLRCGLAREGLLRQVLFALDSAARAWSWRWPAECWNCCS